MENEEEIIKKAKETVEQKKWFYTHLMIYCVVGIFLFVLNMFTRPERLWFHIPMLAWGISLIIHYFLVFGISGLISKDWEKQELEKEIKKLKSQQGSSQIEETLDLNQPIKLKEKQWDERDIV